MHDWALRTINVEWGSERVVFEFSWDSKNYSLVAEGVVDLHMPHRKEWGRSVSVNETRGPIDNGDGTQLFSIEMQTGDVIAIVAQTFHLPT
jgi:hypothetical protein